MACHDAIEGSSTVTGHVNRSEYGGFGQECRRSTRGSAAVRSERTCKTCREPLVQITTEGAYPILRCITGHVWWLNLKTGKVFPYNERRIPPQ